MKALTINDAIDYSFGSVCLGVKYTLGDTLGTFGWVAYNSVCMLDLENVLEGGIVYIFLLPFLFRFLFLSWEKGVKKDWGSVSTRRYIGCIVYHELSCLIFSSPYLHIHIYTYG